MLENDNEHQPPQPGLKRLNKNYMKAITIKQPFASLIVEGIKDIENRTWKTNLRGRVLIHASASKTLDHTPLDEIYSEQQLSDLLSRFTEYELCKREYPHGAIIGSVEIVDCVLDHESIWAEESVRKQYNDGCGHMCAYYIQPYNWVLANPIKFDNPIPCKGKLSFWDYPLTEEELNNINR